MPCVLWNKEISSLVPRIILHCAEELLPWDKCCQIFFFACIWRPKFSNDRFLMVTLQRPHNMWVWKQITEQYLLRKAKCEAPRSLECLSMNNCLTNALQHVHDVILKQRCTTLYSSTPPQSPKHYFDFLYYLLNPSPWQDWESLLSQTVVIAFGFIFCQQLCNDYCCLRLKFMS